MTKVLVMESAKKLNFFPAPNGISKYYSPRTILHHKNLDFTKHCNHAFGSYVQGHNDQQIKNDNSPRTIDCLYLRYTDNHQGGHELLHLPTNKILRRQQVTKMPITTDIIKQVSDLASSERMPTGLKIHNRTNRTLYDSAWIEGVDYEVPDDKLHDDNDDNNDNVNEDNDNNDNIDSSVPTQDIMHPDDIAELEQYIEDEEEEVQVQEEDQESQVQDQDQDQDQDQGIDNEDEENQDDEYEIEDAVVEEETSSFDQLVTTKSRRVSRPVHK